MSESWTPYLSHIRIFPIKSLDGDEVSETLVHGGGGLAHDREYRLCDSAGVTLNGKRLGEKIIAIRGTFDMVFGEVTVRQDGDSLSVQLPREQETLEAWLSERLGLEVRLERDSERGFPDDLKASGPTVISRATLAEVATWFDCDEEEMRRRFRANLEIDGVPAFWEDRLYGRDGEAVEFRIGEVILHGVKPSARCAVPSRDSRTGQISDKAFAKKFAARREATLPRWAETSRFDHFYRLSVNTRIPGSENGKSLQVGDEVRAPSRGQ